MTWHNMYIQESAFRIQLSFGSDVGEDIVSDRTLIISWFIPDHIKTSRTHMMVYIKLRESLFTAPTFRSQIETGSWLWVSSPHLQELNKPFVSICANVYWVVLWIVSHSSFYVFLRFDNKQFQLQTTGDIMGGFGIVWFGFSWNVKPACASLSPPPLRRHSRSPPSWLFRSSSSSTKPSTQRSPAESATGSTSGWVLPLAVRSSSTSSSSLINSCSDFSPSLFLVGSIFCN